MEVIWKEAKDAAQLEWLVPELEAAFSKGLLLDLVEYASGDRANQIACQCLNHETEQNRYQPTSLADKVKIVLMMHARSTNSDWGQTQKALVELLGESKKSTVFRWITLARDLDAEVLEHVKKHKKDLPQAYIIGNKYMLGRGAEARFKLNQKYAKVALDRLIEKLELGEGVAAQAFLSEYCLAYKHLEMWEKAQIKIYGVTATGFPAFARVLKTLQTEAGRQRILACLRERCGLSGRTGGGTADTRAGIEECYTVVQEMEKMKAGTNPSALTQGGGGVPPAGDALFLKDGDPAETEEETGQPDLECLLPEQQEQAAPQVDPVAERATVIMESELHHVVIHSTRDAFIIDVGTRVFTSHKSIVYIEAPTSKAKIFHDFIKLVPQLPTQASWFIPVGSRFDLLSAIMGIVSKTWPKRAAFVVQCGSERQTASARQTYAVYLPLDPTESIPALISSAGCRAKSSEGLRLRCVDRACAFRQEGAFDEDEPDNEHAEIPEDDLECADADGQFDDEEEEEDVAVEGSATAVAPPPKQLRVVNVFPFAHPVALHARIL